MKTIMPIPSDDNDDIKLNLTSNDDISELLAKTDELMSDKQGATEIITELDKKNDSNPATELIRAKLNSLYGDEPAAKEELAEAKLAGSHRSKHQKFIYDLNGSGKSIAEIQVEWHAYYSSLPDVEKHKVWQEFYEEHSRIKANRAEVATKTNPDNRRASSAHSPLKGKSLARGNSNNLTVAELKSKIMQNATSGKKLSKKQHLKSLGFGLGVGLFAILLVSFSFFNERIVAPFISPSRSVSATPIIGVNGVIGAESKIIIPKINLEVPVVYDLGTNEENAVQNALEDGVVHYSGTPNPGEQGNVSIVGHSSNNILNKGKYKFAFVLLNRLEAGDIFYLQKDGVRYTYQVYENRIVPPTDVSVLGTASKPNTATLITCDPPGTSINRRVVVAEQISPDPSSNKAASSSLNDQPQVLPSNAPSLWQRLFGN
ncbi:MAG: sortase [bacterium]|nr:sortase [bacterium]